MELRARRGRGEAMQALSAAMDRDGFDSTWMRLACSRRCESSQARVRTMLTVVVAAQASGLDVLHYDHHFERLGDLLGVRMVWIADPSA